MKNKEKLKAGIKFERQAEYQGYDAKTHQVTLSFASDAPYTRYGETEILRCDDECMDTKRFDDDVMVALFNHDRDEIIGKPIKIWTEKGKAKAVMQFATTQKAQEVEQLVADGVLKGVSVGYIVHEYEYIDDKTEKYGYKGPAYIANKWEVLEFSLVSVPADPTVGIGRTLDDDKENDNKKPEPVAAPQNKAEGEPDASLVKEGDNKMDNVKDLLAAERARCTELNALADKYSVDAEKRSAWLADGEMTVDKARAEVLEIMAQRNTAIKATQVTVTADAEDKLRAAMTDAMAIRAGITIAQPAAGATDFVGMRAMDMARHVLITKGERNVMMMSAEDLFKRSMTTDTFANILDKTAQISMAKSYMEAESTFEAWTNRGSLSDFKEAFRYRLTDAPEPIMIPENGEFSYAEINGKVAGVKLDTKGIAWTYTRQAFINDDLDCFSKFPRKFARAFKRQINRLAYAALAGLTYSSGNKNLGTPGTVSTTTVAEMRKLLRKLKDVNGTSLNFQLKYLLLPTMYEQAALELLHSTANPSGSNSGVANIYRNSFEVIIDAALDDNDEYAWYGAAAKDQIDGVEIDYLNGKAEPTIESQYEFNKLARSYRMYMDFGVKAIDYRGFVKNAGH